MTKARRDQQVAVDSMEDTPMENIEVALGSIATPCLTHGALTLSDVAPACAASDGNRGNAQVGPNCCQSDQFCQP
ncbi:hypothetical protein PF005_g11534 [Phytophthora fragariae]|uniref:Uncharacterized protein n=2 Tax=Phytophthora fragariae TaxID=53985 RepID=A0A6A3EVU7_9STRA|nr:hypothetical protein PF003_g17602 [Phytophthora fragariae]KAE8936733.1 hypothetical protein PF009_g13349 [Phytophthora fragariae]KAE9092022.1 hypothetical protein PF007_g18672 [Phytophthora fragariae]KAE9143754.1 hypothetical protein PF006_g11231 [Phytophthora fragariae]KAE9206858.1 hypothetical protein PF002_g19870 [Phytophthora fragariae]